MGKKVNSKIEYILDFSQNGYFDEEKDKDDNLDSLIREAIEESENQSENSQIDARKIKDFLTIQKKLHYIAVENNTIMKTKMCPNSPTIIIDLESETLDLDTENLKSTFKEVVNISKCVCFESRKNGKIGLTVEINLSKNNNYEILI